MRTEYYVSVREGGMSSLVKTDIGRKNGSFLEGRMLKLSCEGRVEACQTVSAWKGITRGQNSMCKGLEGRSRG